MTTTPVWVIEEPGATFVFYDKRAAAAAFPEELASMNGQAVLYAGLIPSEHATRREDGAPGDAAVEYALCHVEADAATRAVIESWSA